MEGLAQLNQTDATETWYCWTYVSKVVQCYNLSYTYRQAYHMIIGTCQNNPTNKMKLIHSF